MVAHLGTNVPRVLSVFQVLKPTTVVFSLCTFSFVFHVVIPLRQPSSDVVCQIGFSRSLVCSQQDEPIQPITLSGWSVQSNRNKLLSMTSNNKRRRWVVTTWNSVGQRRLHWPQYEQSSIIASGQVYWDQRGKNNWPKIPTTNQIGGKTTKASTTVTDIPWNHYFLWRNVFIGSCCLVVSHQFACIHGRWVFVLKLIISLSRNFSLFSRGNRYWDPLENSASGVYFLEAVRCKWTCRWKHLGLRNSLVQAWTRRKLDDMS